MDEWTEHLRQARMRILDEVSDLRGKFLAGDDGKRAQLKEKVTVATKKKYGKHDDEEDSNDEFSIASLGEWLMDSII